MVLFRSYCKRFYLFMQRVGILLKTSFDPCIEGVDALYAKRVVPFHQLPIVILTSNKLTLFLHVGEQFGDKLQTYVNI